MLPLPVVPVVEGVEGLAAVAGGAEALALTLGDDADAIRSGTVGTDAEPVLAGADSLTELGC